MERAQHLINNMPPRHPVDPRNLPVALALLAALEQRGKLHPDCVVDSDDEGTIYCQWPGGVISCLVTDGRITVERLWESDVRGDEAWDFSPAAIEAACDKVTDLLRF